MHDRPQVSEDTESATTLIRRLVTTYVSRPESLWLEANESDAGVAFVMRCAGEDMRTVIGSNKGSHVAALEFLVLAMGRSREVPHRLRVLEPDDGERRGSYIAQTADSHDATGTASLIQTVCEACGVEVQCVTSMASAPTVRPLSYVFQLFTRTADDFNSLTLSPAGSRNGLSVATALETLMRAAGRRQGVVYAVKAEKP